MRIIIDREHLFQARAPEALNIDHLMEMSDVKGQAQAKRALEIAKELGNPFAPEILRRLPRGANLKCFTAFVT